MIKIKRALAICAALIAIVLLACACNDKLDINHVNGFELVTMPVQKKSKQNEIAEIRCQLVREGNYQQTVLFYSIYSKGRQRRIAHG